jgi:hypothetical protein
MMTMTCPKCGKDSPADWLLCKECMPSSDTKKSAETRRIPASLQRRKRIRHTFRNTTLSLTLLIGLAAAFFFGCEFYTIPPIDPIPEGVTLIVWRNGDISEPFFNSPDAAMSKLTAEESIITVIPTNRTILELPYMEYLYLKSPIGNTAAATTSDTEEK